MVTALDRKLLRDLRRMKGQATTIGAVVACGIAGFLAAMGTYLSLAAAQREYYEEARFAHLFVGVKRAPEHIARRAAEIAGVADAELRVVFDAILDVPGEAVTITGRFVSLPDRGEARLNRVHLVQGRFPEAGRSDEALVNEAFFKARQLRLGDHVHAVLNGKKQKLRLVGTGNSPEYIYAVRGYGEVPDDRRFGIFWMRRQAAARAFDLEGAFNDLSLRLAPGARKEPVIDAIDRLLARYGGLGAVGRDDQASARFIADELEQQGFMASTIPVILMCVAAFLLIVVLGRAVAAQRGQIATLKALGYSDRRIAAHYMKFAAVIVGGGTAAGIGLGNIFGDAMTRSYAPFFRFPDLNFRFELWPLFVVIALSATVGALAAWSAARRISRLPPAEAMRPPAPAAFQQGWLDRTRLFRRLPARLLMVLRPMLDRPWRSLMSIVALASALPIIVLGLFWRDAIDLMVDVAFGLADRSTLAIGFAEPVPDRARFTLAAYPGILRIEPHRAVPVRLRAGHRTTRTVLEGMSEQSELHRPLDTNFKPLRPPTSGILLTERLGANLGVAPGDRVTIEVLDGKRPVREAIVAGLSQEFIGLAARMEIGALHHLLGEAPAMNGAAIRADPAMLAALHKRFKETPKITSVSARRDAVRRFIETTMWLILVFSAIFTGFALTVAVGVIYNNARIALAERAWELASLRIIGFTRGEILANLLGQLAIELALALPLGIELSHWAVVGVIAAHQSDSFAIPVAISPSTYVIAVGAVLAAGALSVAIISRELGRLDLIAVLKTRE